MFDSFSTALSALNANSAAISVTGDNLANLNTVGFKASRTAFGNLVSQFVSEGFEVGAGVGRPSTQRLFSQGSMQITGGKLDAAIQGNGFFVLRDAANNEMFTRAGNFSARADGTLVTITGERVQGWPAVNGQVSPSGAITDIVLPGGGVLPPTPTSEVMLKMNFDVSAADGTVFSAPASIIDSLGQSHVITLNFTKSSPTDWAYDVTIPGDDLASGTPGSPTSLTTGTVSFGPDGLLTSPAAPGTIPITVSGFANGAADAAVNWQLYNNGTEPMITQFAKPSALSSINANGTPAAELIEVEITDGGYVIARYTEGVEQIVGLLAIAAISNPESMVSAGNNNLRTTSGTADPAIGAAGAGGRGSIRGGTLEASTADVAQEFANLIRYQRAYQANSRVVTTADEITQETLNLKR